MDVGNGGLENAPPAADLMEASCCGTAGISRGRAALDSEGAFPGASPGADSRDGRGHSPEADLDPAAGAGLADGTGSSSRIGTAAPEGPMARAWSGMRRLAGGIFLMGSDSPSAIQADGEGPVREVALKPFLLDAHAVTNRRFARFVAERRYVTEAERLGWSFVFAGLLPDDFPPTRGVAHAPWWRQVEGACWRHPRGPGSGLDGRDDHPVVHVSWNDAMAYCEWAGARLPTEADWEDAARGGLVRKAYPWGDELTPDGKHRCNIWQGSFPARNTGEDGWLDTAPVDAFPPNGFGLFNMCGNTWEWCADWFSRDFHRKGSHADPRGPAVGTHRVIRGGSYLCHAAYCNRYRVSARSGNTPDSASGHMGFRIARDIDAPGSSAFEAPIGNP